MAVLIGAPVAAAKAVRRPPLSVLYEWRTTYSFGGIEAAALAVYIFLLVITLPYHEPWADEAQAWLIARDNTFGAILHRRLHYEGSPAIWHFTLRTLHLMRVPWSAIGWCGALFAIAGVYVWLRFSPFPPIVRFLLPFTFFVQYQYAVVARSYVMFPLFTFALCTAFCARRPRIVAYAVAASLLANLCMQGMVISTVSTCIYIWELRRKGLLNWGVSIERKKLISAASIILASWTFCIYTALPAPDVGFVLDGQVSSGPVHQLLVDWVPGTPRNLPEPPPELTASENTAMMLAAVPPRPSWSVAPRQRLAWELRAPSARRTIPDVAAIMLFPLIELPSELFWSISTSNFLACLWVVLLVAWARNRGGLRFLLPSFVLWLVGEFLWVADHHGGMLVLALLAGAWIVQEQRPHGSRHSPILEKALIGTMAFVLMLQVGWTVHAVRRDRHATYDPSAQTAQFLSRQTATKRMAAFHFWATGIEPYFTKNPFFNLPSSWWQWCSNIVVDNAHRQVIASRPDIVVYTLERPKDVMRNQLIPIYTVTGYEPPDPILTDLAKNGYVETHRFCGDRFSRLDAAYEVCNVIFEPVPTTIYETAGTFVNRIR